jgi:hypothetical protein
MSADISLTESVFVIVIQITGSALWRAHSATREVFPYPAGAMTTVVLGAECVRSGKRRFLDMKLGARVGTIERERVMPEVISKAGLTSPASFWVTRFVVMR